MDERIEATVEGDIRGYLSYEAVSIYPLQAVYATTDISAYTMSFTPFSTTNTHLDTIDVDKRYSPQVKMGQILRIVAMGTRYVQNGDDWLNFPYVLVECDGVFGWLFSANISFEPREVTPLTIYPLYKPVRNFFIQIGPGLVPLLFFITLFYLTPIACCVLLHDIIGNFFSKWLRGNLLFYILATLNIVLMFFMAISLWNASFVFGASIDTILLFLYLIFLSFGSIGVFYAWYRTSWCEECNLWDGLLLTKKRLVNGEKLKLQRLQPIIRTVMPRLMWMNIPPTMRKNGNTVFAHIVIIIGNTISQ